MFGEMSFMDGSPRSTTIETTKKTVVFGLSRQDLEELQGKAGLQDIYNKIISNIAIININRLRSSNETQVKTLRTSLRRFQVRQGMGKFLIFSLLAFGIVNLLSLFFKPFLVGLRSALLRRGLLGASFGGHRLPIKKIPLLSRSVWSHKGPFIRDSLRSLPRDSLVRTPSIPGKLSFDARFDGR